MKRPLALRPLPLLFLLCAASVQGQNDPLSWINGIRHAAGVSGLAPDGLLSRTAESWAERLARTGVLSHRGADGSSALDRYRALGGTEVRVGEILGAGPDLPGVERAWLRSEEHRDVTLSPPWTHVGWGRSPSGSGEVWVVLFCQKLVDELRIEEQAAGLAVSGRFIEAVADHPLLYAGLVPCQPAAWDAQTRRFLFQVPAPLEGYFRLGYVLPGESYKLTNAFTWPRGTEFPAGSGHSAE
ncbi:MAG: CAP domain-containing protein, partial [Spirochaetia bacterium]